MKNFLIISIVALLPLFVFAEGPTCGPCPIHEKEMKNSCKGAFCQSFLQNLKDTCNICDEASFLINDEFQTIDAYTKASKIHLEQKAKYATVDGQAGSMDTVDKIVQDGQGITDSEYRLMKNYTSHSENISNEITNSLEIYKKIQTKINSKTDKAGLSNRITTLEKELNDLQSTLVSQRGNIDNRIAENRTRLNDLGNTKVQTEKIKTNLDSNTPSPNPDQSTTASSTVQTTPTTSTTPTPTAPSTSDPKYNVKGEYKIGCLNGIEMCTTIVYHDTPEVRAQADAALKQFVAAREQFKNAQPSGAAQAVGDVIQAAPLGKVDNLGATQPASGSTAQADQSNMPSPASTPQPPANNTIVPLQSTVKPPLAISDISKTDTSGDQTNYSVTFNDGTGKTKFSCSKTTSSCNAIDPNIINKDMKIKLINETLNAPIP